MARLRTTALPTLLLTTTPRREGCPAVRLVQLAIKHPFTARSPSRRTRWKSRPNLMRQRRPKPRWIGRAASIKPSNRSQPLAAHAPAIAQGGPATFGGIAFQETVLPFATDFGRLILAFHKIKSPASESPHLSIRSFAGGPRAGQGNNQVRPVKPARKPFWVIGRANLAGPGDCRPDRRVATPTGLACFSGTPRTERLCPAPGDPPHPQPMIGRRRFSANFRSAGDRLVRVRREESHARQEDEQPANCRRRDTIEKWAAPRWRKHRHCSRENSNRPAER